jgi:alpha-beta hydrolase superfamily lysophospholipase
MKSRMMQILQSVLFILISTWLLLSLLLFLFQSKFVYFPLPGQAATPADIGLAYEEVLLTTSDNVRIHGWYLPHPTPRATVLFLHGNGGNVSHRLEKLSLFHQLGLSTFIIDYRGYGLSAGMPSEQGTYLDAEAAWMYLADQKNIRSESVILYGESLGGGVGAWLAGRYTPGALVLESPFTSITDIARHYYPYLPVTLLTRIHYPTLERLKDIRCPVLVIHSQADEIIPYSHGRTIYQAANIPKSFLEINGDHNNGFYLSGKLYTDGINRFITSWF